jgi:hypothetical protein
MPRALIGLMALRSPNSSVYLMGALIVHVDGSKLGSNTWRRMYAVESIPAMTLT